MEQMLLLSATWVSGALIVGWLVGRSSWSSRKKKIAGLCIAYLTLIGVFGHIYHDLYIRKHERFAFGSEVLQTRRDESSDSRQEDIKRISSGLAALEQIVEELRDNSKLTLQIRCNGVVPFR